MILPFSTGRWARCVSLRPGGSTCWRRVRARGDRCPRCWADLAASPTVTDRIELAAEPRLPAWTAALLGADPEPMVRVLVAERADVEPDLLVRLATDREASVRARVAGATATPPATVLDLAADPAPAVAAAVARRPDAPPDVLARLITHTDPRVRAAAGAHPTTDEALERRLVTAEADPRVLLALASKATLSPVVRSWLRRHPSPRIARAAGRSAARTGSFAQARSSAKTGATSLP